MSASAGYNAFIEKYKRCSDAPQSGYDQTYRVESTCGGNFYTCREISYSSLTQHAIFIDPGVFTTLQSINHPCIVKVHDIFHDTGLQKIFLITELLPDMTLDDLIAAHVRTHEVVIEEVLWKVASYLASALYFLLFQLRGFPISSIFKRFVTTRDCVVCRNGLVKLLLTDLVFLINPNYVKLMTYNKQCYCAPEVILSLQYGSKSEMWSLGCILYELCTQRRVIENPNPMLLQSQIMSMENRIVIPGYSEDFCSLLNGLLRYDPENRFSAEYVCSIRQCALVLDAIKDQYESTYKYERDYIPIYNGAYSWDHNSTVPAVYNQPSRNLNITGPPPHPTLSGQPMLHGSGTYAYNPNMQLTKTVTPGVVNTYYNTTSKHPQTEVIPISVDSRPERMTRDPAAINYADGYSAQYPALFSDSKVISNNTGVTQLLSPLLTSNIQTNTSHIQHTPLSIAENALSNQTFQSPTSYTLQNVLYEQTAQKSSHANMLNISGQAFDPDKHERALPYDMIGTPMLQNDSLICSQPPHLQKKSQLLDIDSLNQKTQPTPRFQAAVQPVIVANIESRLSLMDKIKHRSANINALGSDATLLMQAVIEFSSDGVIRHMALAGKRTREGITALMLAASVGNIYAIKKITEAADSIVQKETRMQDYTNGKTALMYAVEGQHEEAVEILSRHEATLTLNDGTTALMLAAVHKSDRIVEILANLEGGMVDSVGRTALIHAMSIHNYKAVSLLAKWEGEKLDHNGLTPLMIAARAGDEELVEILKLCGIHLRTPAGETSLMAAAAAGHVAVCRTLAPQYSGATNIIGMTALMYAAEAGHAEICDILLPYEKGKKDNAGRTALMYAASTGHVDCIRKLLRDEERMRATDGTTALMLAAELGFTAAVAELVRREAGISRYSDETALSMAIMNNRKDCVQLLLKAEGMLKCPGGHTPAEYANHLNRKEILVMINSALMRVE